MLLELSGRPKTTVALYRMQQEVHSRGGAPQERVLATKVNLATALQYLGQYEEAHVMFEDAAREAEASSDFDTLETALNGQGTALDRMFRSEEALEIHRRNLDLKIKRGNALHFTVKGGVVGVGRSVMSTFQWQMLFLHLLVFMKADGRKKVRWMEVKKKQREGEREKRMKESGS